VEKVADLVEEEQELLKVQGIHLVVQVPLVKVMLVDLDTEPVGFKLLVVAGVLVQLG
jgi:hypothetical protein